MKQTVSIVGIALFMCCLAGGCGPADSGDRAEQQTVGQPTEIFPSFAAGTWQEKDGVWRIVIEPNGVVSSAVITLAEVNLRPHQTTKIEMKDGSISTFTGGDFLAECNPITRALSVYIETREIKLRILDHKMDGNRVDSFYGPVSEDGRTWEPDWIAIIDYGPDLPQDENDIDHPTPLVFEKVEKQQEPGIVTD